MLVDPICVSARPCKKNVPLSSVALPSVEVGVVVFDPITLVVI